MTAETGLALRNMQLSIAILMDDYRSADRLAKHYQRLATEFIVDLNLASEATGFIERGSKYALERDLVGKNMMNLVAKELVNKSALHKLKIINPSGYFVIKDMTKAVGFNTEGDSPLWGKDFSVEMAPSRLYDKAKELGVLKK